MGGIAFYRLDEIGNEIGAPAQLHIDTAPSLSYEVPLLDTSYVRDILPGLEAGLYGASFRFQVMQEELVQEPKRSAYNPDGIPEELKRHPRWVVWRYERRRDKTWGLTDCISFVVMREQGLRDALTADSHFRQAGFRPLLTPSR